MTTDPTRQAELLLENLERLRKLVVTDDPANGDGWLLVDADAIKRTDNDVRYWALGPIGDQPGIYCHPESGEEGRLGAHLWSIASVYRYDPDEQPTAHERRLLQAHLDAAWLRRCGRDGSPGNWIIPGGFLPVMEGGELEVDVYPIYASLDPDGRPRGWSAHMTPGPGIVDAWDWRINAGWDDLAKEQVAALEDLGGCLDDRRSSFMTLGSHQEPPPITDEVVQALAVIDHG